MSTITIFDDVEQALIELLTSALDVPVSTRKSHSPRFIRLFRTGGSRVSRISERAQITVEAYAQTESAASGLLQQARSVIADLAGRRVQGRGFKEITELGGPANLPDPTSPEHHRYTYTPVIHIRALRERDESPT